jgi:hypothetical protein
MKYGIKLEETKEKKGLVFSLGNFSLVARVLVAPSSDANQNSGKEVCILCIE